LRAIDQFRSNASYVDALIALHGALSAQTTAAIDLSDLLRAAIVQIVGALDHYVHERVREGMIDIYRGQRPSCGGYERFPMPMQLVHTAQSIALPEAYISDAIRKVTTFQTYQRSAKIATAIANFSQVKLWKAVSAELKMKPEDINRQLHLIVDRRNQIAHEADLDPSNPGVRFPIHAADVVAARSFIGDVVEAMERVV